MPKNQTRANREQRAKRICSGLLKSRKMPFERYYTAYSAARARCVGLVKTRQRARARGEARVRREREKGGQVGPLCALCQSWAQNLYKHTTHATRYITLHYTIHGAFTGWGCSACARTYTTSEVPHTRIVYSAM